MFTRHEVEYVTKRGGQLLLADETGKTALVYLDLVKNDAGEVTGFKPKTKNPAEVDYLNANKDLILSQLRK